MHDSGITSHPEIPLQIHCHGSKDSNRSTSAICIKIGAEMKKKCIIRKQNDTSLETYLKAQEQF